MKAVAIYAHGGGEQLCFENNFPDPVVGHGDVLVRTRATSINYHDVFTRNGMPGIKYPFPIIMGMDVAGASGGVGVCAVQLAKLYGAEVIAAGSTEEKGVRLIELGADHYINYAKENFEKAIYTRYGKPGRKSPNAGVDVVINYTGGDTWGPSIRTLTRRGRLLTCGATAGFDPKEDIRHIWTFERQICKACAYTTSSLFLEKCNVSAFRHRRRSLHRSRQ